jgi:hypothetical protein
MNSPQIIAWVYKLLKHCDKSKHPKDKNLCFAAAAITFYQLTKVELLDNNKVKIQYKLCTYELWVQTRHSCILLPTNNQNVVVE